MKMILIAAISFIMGATFEKYDFCMGSISRDFFVSGDSKKIMGILTTILISAILFNLLIGLDVVLHIPIPLSAATIIAGIAFGIGMIFAGSCMAGMLFKLSRGYIALLISFIGTVMGFGSLGLIIPLITGNKITQNQTTETVLIHGSDRLLLVLATFAIGMWVLWVYKKRKTERNNKMERTDTGNPGIRLPNWSDFMAGAAMIAILNTIFYIVVSRPIGLSGFMGYIAASFAKLINRPWVQNNAVFSHILKNTDIIIHVFPFIIGAFVSACLGGRFGIRLPSWRQAVFSLIGGFLMGVSAPLMMGCNITHILGGLPQLEPASIIATIAIFAGIWLGLRIIRLITMIWKEE